MLSPSFLDVGVSDDAQNWHLQNSPETAAHWVYAKPIQKSQQDDREYKLFRLENGLQAMLIQDAKADKAAASLDVAVGHLHDPVSNPDPPSPATVYLIHYQSRSTCRALRTSANISCSWYLPHRT
jgi:hypothetical protein